LQGRTINKLLPDYSRPRVYALNQASGSVAGTLLALNSADGSILNEISLNTNPTDMAITPAGDSLYVINAGSRTISKVDLASFAVVAEKPISTPNTYNVANPLYIAVGRSNLVYFTDGAWAPSITIFDFLGGTNVAVYDDGDGAGGIAVTRNGQFLYRWRQYGWGAGNVNSWVTRYDAATNSNLTPLESSFVSWRRDPIDTRIFLDGGERWVFNKQQMFAATNVSVLLNQFADNIYGLSLDGSIALGPTQVFNTQNGLSITNLSFSTTVQALSGDQKKLFRYNGPIATLYIYDMASIAPVAGLDLVPTPANGSVVSLPLTNLAWSVSPYALAYNLYLGTNQAQVSSATPASSQYVGRVYTPAASLSSPLSPGGNYYWRVDVVGFSATNAGPVWSFVVSPLTVSPARLNVGAIAGYSPKAASLSLTGAGALNWSATVAGPNWLALDTDHGTSPSTLTVSFNTAAFSSGLYSNRIDITSGGLTLQVPVTLDIKPLNIVKMVADYQRPYIYAIQAPALSGQSGQLLFINTSTEAVEKTLPIGLNPADLTVHYGEGRLYIASWTENSTYVVDLNNQTLLPPLHLGTDVYKISAGKPGQLIIEGEDQWVGISLINTADGSVVTSGLVREGDGKFDPSGRYYYHGDNNISGAGITKYDMSTNTFVSVGGAGGHYYYGSRNVIMSPDGSRIFWTGASYDANLNDQGYLGEEIYATTAHGDLALGNQHVFNSHNGQTLYTWPFSTTVMAVAGDQQKVFLFNSTTKQLVSIPMGSIATVPGPGLNPTPADGAVINPPLTQVSWTLSPLALGYRVFMGTNQANVSLADTNSALYLGTTSSNVFSLPGGLVSPGLTYYWRVDTVGFSTVTPGTAWRFTAAGLVVSPQILALKGVAGLSLLPQTISIDAPIPTDWVLATSQPWVSASAISGTSPSTVTLSFDITNLAPGFYTNEIILTANDTTLRLPLTLQLIVLNATKMVADRNRDYLYVLHPGSGTFSDAFLLFLNTGSGVVEKVIPIGTNPTDLSVNNAEDRLYVSNWQHNQTHVVDLATQTELAPLALGTDVYKINAGRAGRIVVEGEDQWVGMSLINTINGSVLASGLVREGDGEYDPTGRYYYHGDNNISGAGIGKFDLNADAFVSVAGAGGHYYFGSRNIVMSLDGSRLFWTSAMYDANLTDFGSLGDEIYSCSTNGAVAFGGSQAYDTATKKLIYTLPATSNVSAVDRKNQRFWYFNSATASIGSIPMRVIQSPSITQQPAANTSVALGSSVYLTVTAQGFSPISYQWTLGGANVTGETNYFLSIPAVQLGQEGDYRVVVSNPFGSVTSSVAHVTLLRPPTLVSQSPNTNILAGQTLNLSVTAGGTPPFIYTWLFGSAPVSNGSSPSLTVPNAQSGNSGDYHVVIANSYGSVTGAVITVQVLPSAPVIATDPVSQSVSASSNATFNVSAIGSQPITYQWLFRGSPLPGASDSQLILSGVQSANGGAYQAVALNSYGAVTSAVATLTVLPMAPYFTAQPQNGAVSAGSLFTLAGLANGSQPITYQWLRDGANVSGAISPSFAVTNSTVADSGNYALVASNIAGSSTSSVAHVTVYQTPTLVKALTNQVVDINSTVALDADAQASPALTYSWQFNGRPMPASGSTLVISNIQPSQTGFYSVVATNQYGSVSSRARVSVLGASSQVLVWGDDSGGQTNVPANLNDVVAAVGGDYHSIALHHDGSLVAWGRDFYGQTDVPTNPLRFVSVASGADHNLAIAENGTIVAWGRNDFGQCTIPLSISNNVLAVAAGDSHSMALLSSGSVVVWGDKTYGQTFVPQGLNGVRVIAAGRNHCLALRTNGTVVGWGDNSYGHASPSRLTITNAVGIAGGFLHSVALLADGTVLTWGDNTFGQTNMPPGLSNVVAIAAGDFHTLALRANGSLVGWGDDRYGQATALAGLGSATSVACGYYHSFALTPALIPLQISLAPSGFVLHWTGPGTLQWAPTPFGPFNDVPVQTTWFTNADMSAPARFFRLWR
jgi:hypothetical protein